MIRPFAQPTDEASIRAGRRAAVLSWIADCRGYDSSAGVLFFRTAEGWVLSTVDSWVITGAGGETRDDAIRDLYERTRKATELGHRVEDGMRDRAQLERLGEQLGLVR
jgi:hypothetical protein